MNNAFLGGAKKLKSSKSCVQFSGYVEMKVSQACNYSEYLLTMPSNNLQTTRLKTQFHFASCLVFNRNSNIASSTERNWSNDISVSWPLFIERFLCRMLWKFLQWKVNCLFLFGPKQIASHWKANDTKSYCYQKELQVCVTHISPVRCIAFVVPKYSFILASHVYLLSILLGRLESNTDNQGSLLTWSNILSSRLMHVPAFNLLTIICFYRSTLQNSLASCRLK